MPMNRIAQLRTQRSMTQAHLAKAAGLSLNTIKNAESGRKLSKETLLCLASVLGTTPKELARAARRTGTPPERLTRIERWIGERIAVQVIVVFLLFNVMAWLSVQPFAMFYRAVRDNAAAAAFYDGMLGQYQLLLLIVLLAGAPAVVFLAGSAAYRWRYGSSPEWARHHGAKNLQRN